jgi:hypothetical protein
MHWGSFLSWSPRVMILILVGVAATLRFVREPAVRMLWLVAFASIVPVALHPFHLDRFLLPGAVLLWVLAAVGIARHLPVGATARAAVLALLVVVTAARPDVDGMMLGRAVGLVRPEFEQYQRDVLAQIADLSGDRMLETNGLERATFDQLLDLYEHELRPDDRVGWIGNSHIFSPCALHAGLAMRGRRQSRMELAAGHFDEDFVAIGNDDPQWSDERLYAWAETFTVLLTTEPVDMTQNKNRRWLAHYQERIEASGRWEKKHLGSIAIARALQDPITVQIFVMRSPTTK